jgi:flagellar hook assembly protein FlgD
VKHFDGQAGGPGYVDVQWNGTDDRGAPVASGVYLYRVRADHFVDVKKMVLLK